MSRAGYERLPMYALSGSHADTSSHDHIPSAPPISRRNAFSYLSSWGASSNSYFWNTRWSLRPRTCLGLLKILVPVAIIAVFIVFTIWEPYIQLVFYSREWIQSEIQPIKPLSGCFSPERVSSLYNISEAVYGPKKHEVHAGVPMQLGLDCYEFAGTVRNRAEEDSSEYVAPEERIIYHSYWRVDLVQFGPRQEWMLKSYFATQNLATSRFILWSNGDLGDNEIVRKYLRTYPESFEIRVVDIPTLARGTALDGSDRLRMDDEKAWVDGDLVRLLVVWTYGGVWIDMDSLLTRDLGPLLEHEFVTQWDCVGRAYQALNGALMHFRQHSPYVCEMFHIMATEKPPRPDSTDWGAILYFKLWRRLIATGIPPFKILPFCFSDGRACGLDNRLPDPFEQDKSSGKWTMGLNMSEGGGLAQTLNKVFSVHLHNQWNKEFPKNGWVDRLLLQQYDQKLGGDSEEL